MTGLGEREADIVFDIQKNNNRIISHKAYSGLIINGTVSNSADSAVVDISGSSGTVGFKTDLSSTSFLAEASVSLVNSGTGGQFTATLPAAQWNTNISNKIRYWGDVRLSISPTNATFKTNGTIIDPLTSINFESNFLMTVEGSELKLSPGGNHYYSLYTQYNDVSSHGPYRAGTGVSFTTNADGSENITVPDITNSLFSDAAFTVFSSTDSTKEIKLNAGSISTSTTRTLTAQDKDYTIADNADVDVLETNTVDRTGTRGMQADLPMGSNSINNIKHLIGVSGTSYITNFTYYGAWAGDVIASNYIAKVADSDKLDGQDSSYYRNWSNITNNDEVIIDTEIAITNAMYVSANGSDSNDGLSIATPKRTITNAISTITMIRRCLRQTRSAASASASLAC